MLLSVLWSVNRCMWQLGAPGGNAVLGSPQTCRLRENAAADAHSPLGHCGPYPWQVSSPLKVFYIFLEDLQKVFPFPLSGE